MTAVVTGDSGGAGWWFRIPIDGEGQGSLSMAFTKEKIETILQEVKENLRFPSSELPSTLSSRYLQVENDVKSDILLDRAKKVLKHGMKHSNFHMWSNESSLRVYVPEFDRYMLK